MSICLTEVRIRFQYAVKGQLGCKLIFNRIKTYSWIRMVADCISGNAPAFVARRMNYNLHQFRVRAASMRLAFTLIYVNFLYR